MIKRILVFSLFLIVSTFTFGADNFVRAGLLKTSLTISPGYLLQRNCNNIYLNGESEYFAEDRISLRGDAFFYSGSQTKPELMDINHHVLFGVFYHFPCKQFDFYSGIQPGITIARPLPPFSYLDYVYPETKALPTLSVMTGVTFYLFDYFNFFANVRYIHAKYLAVYYGPIPLDELTISAGLGLQIQTKRKFRIQAVPPF